MLGLAILIGHLLGDFVLQDDWMAAKKTKSTLVCAVHCLAYTFGMFAVISAFHDLPAWFYAVVGLTHFPIDRFGLAKRLMKANGQENFIGYPFGPWSVIIVDNTLHLVIAYWAASLALLDVRWPQFWMSTLPFAAWGLWLLGKSIQWPTLDECEVTKSPDGRTVITLIPRS